ncbi:MAG TPA: hypothetical protein ENH85_09910 [Candidatus Scalindua sp.]|nr:hypothetical protein [Candidatus Scalindua sp.]
MKFKLKTGHYQNKVDVQKAGKYLSSKRDKRFSDIEIVEDNRNEKKPLYKIFTWEDTEAAEKQRIYELRLFERNLVVIDENEPIERLREKPAIIRIPENLVKEEGSNMKTIAVTIKEVCSNKDMMNYVIEECKSDLRKVVKKFNRFVQLKKHISKVEAVIEEM